MQWINNTTPGFTLVLHPGRCSVQYGVMSDPSEPTADHWRRRAAETTLPPSLSSAGHGVLRHRGNFTVVNPATGKPLVEVAAGDTADIDAAVAAAAEAFPGWSGLSATERGTLLCRFADLIGDHIDELALLVTLEMGKPIGDSPHRRGPRRGGRVPLLRRGHRQTRGRTATHLRRQRRNGCGECRWGWSARWSRGTSPRHRRMESRPPRWRPATRWSSNPPRNHPVGAAARRARHRSGIPPGVFNVVPGLGATAGRALGLHPGVACRHSPDQPKWERCSCAMAANPI